MQDAIWKYLSLKIRWPHESTFLKIHGCTHCLQICEMPQNHPQEKGVFLIFGVHHKS